MASGVKSDTSKRLGSLLLQGWAMLAENCPSCRVPLMKERASDERLCVNCDTKYVPDGQRQRPTNRAPRDQDQHTEEEEPQQLEPQQDNSESEHSDDIARCTYDPRADPRLGPFASSSSSAAPEPLGDAAGPSMAGQLNGRTSMGAVPFAADTSHHSAVGTSAAPTGTRAVAIAGRGPGEPGSSTGRAAGGAASSDGASGADSGGAGAPAAAAANPVEDVADLLSAKMLQGWALLDKYCPRCNTVLVRSKANKRMFCVACDAWVLTESDTQQQQQQQKAPPAAAEQLQQQPGDAPLQGRAQEVAPATTASAQSRPSLDSQQPQLTAAAATQQQQQQPVPLLQPQPQAARSLQHALGAGLPDLTDDMAQHFVSPIAAAGTGVGTPASQRSPSQQQQPQQQPQQLLLPPAAYHQQQPLLQLPPMYQQFFTPIAAAAAAGAVAGCSRGSSPPHQWPLGGPGSSWSQDIFLGSLMAAPAQQLQQQQPQQQQQQQQQQRQQPQQQQQQHRASQPASSAGHGVSYSSGSSNGPGPNTNGGAGSGGGGVGGGGVGGGGKQPSGTSLLLSIGRTVALKMSEAQGLLERTPALDTERARSYVSFISDCLDLLSKLHNLQQ